MKFIFLPAFIASAIEEAGQPLDNVSIDWLSENLSWADQHTINGYTSLLYSLKGSARLSDLFEGLPFPGLDPISGDEVVRTNELERDMTWSSSVVVSDKETVIVYGTHETSIKGPLAERIFKAYAEKFGLDAALKTPFLKAV